MLSPPKGIGGPKLSLGKARSMIPQIPIGQKVIIWTGLYLFGCLLIGLFALTLSAIASALGI